ncbi:MAG: DUF2948 family protein [Pseudomonadota bacterium]
MASLRDYKPLQLMAGDADDLGVLSAVFQDAIAKLGDFAYLPEARRFALVGNRFLWECAGKRKTGPFARVRAGVHFDDVKSVQFQNLRRDAPDSVVEILAIGFDAGDDGAGQISIELSGGGAIRLEVECINAYMSDISDPWRTRSRPTHDT